jgi:hypothetical protein
MASADLINDVKPTSDSTVADALPRVEDALAEVLRPGGSEMHHRVISSLRARFPSWTYSTPIVDRLLDLVPIANKGFGVIAARDIAVGETLLVESPLVRARPGSPAERAVAALSQEARAQLFDLCTSNESRFGPGKTVQSVWLTNALPLPDGEQAIFPKASRFNHACRASAFHLWDAASETQSVVAAAPIPRGAEVTLCYCKEGTRDERREFLRRAFGFECECEACSVSGVALEESDARQVRIRALDAEINSAASRWSPSEQACDTPSILALMSERLTLMQQEGLAEAVWVKQAVEDFEDLSEEFS